MTEKLDTDNIYIDEGENYVAIRVNTRIYKIHSIMNAADEFLEESNFIVDGDPEKDIIVKFVPKRRFNRQQLADLAHKFCTLLVTFSSTR
jgi:hypothetical protein